MILNSLNNQFVIRFPANFFYPEIEKKWTPVVRRLKLPYESLEDFINATIQSVSFPSIELDLAQQQQGQRLIKYRPGKELEPLLERNLTVTFKLSEGFISYWILFEQVQLYLDYRETSPFWPPMYISFLDHHGFELLEFSFNKIVPQNLSQFEISYATTAAEFRTFTMNLVYNMFTLKNKIDRENYDVRDSSD